MAKKKYLTAEEFQNRFKSRERLEFSTKSPFNSISVSSEKTLFFAWHWDPSIAITGATGTAYACRVGGYPYKFDFDVHSLRLNKYGVPEVFHVYTDYHHTNEMPQFINDQMPDDIKNKVEKYLAGKKLGEVYESIK